MHPGKKPVNFRFHVEVDDSRDEARWAVVEPHLLSTCIQPSEGRWLVAVEVAAARNDQMVYYEGPEFIRR